MDSEKKQTENTETVLPEVHDSVNQIKPSDPTEIDLMQNTTNKTDASETDVGNGSSNICQTLIEPAVENKDSLSELQVEQAVVPMGPEMLSVPTVPVVDKPLAGNVEEECVMPFNQTSSSAVEISQVSQPYTDDLIINSEVKPTKLPIESKRIDEKCEGIYLETTTETIAAESSKEEETGDTTAAESTKNETETSENLVHMEKTSATADTFAKSEPAISTPKAVKKKSKTSTPTKHSLNDSHASQKRRKKDPAAPKAPLNGYLVYFNDERADMRMQNPNMGFGELTKIIALKWRDLPTDQKQRFINEADLDKERYVKEMAEYKKSDSYRQYVKETSQAKQARNEEAANNSMQNDSLNSMPNNFTLANETNVAGFDIPIFTEEFVEHCKTRENEMRLVRKEITELEQQNSVLHKHIEIMKQSSGKLDTDLERYQATNNQLKNKMDTFRQTIINCNIQLPNTMELPTPNNIDEYIMKMYVIVGNTNTGNQNDLAFASRVKAVLSKINFGTLFE